MTDTVTGGNNDTKPASAASPTEAAPTTTDSSPAEAATPGANVGRMARDLATVLVVP